MLETDWMQYDIWMNLKFFRYNEPVRLRRNQRYPLAQLVPVRRESNDGKWNLQDNSLNCVGAEKEKGVEIFDSWNAYNYKNGAAVMARRIRQPITRNGESPVTRRCRDNAAEPAKLTAS